MRKAKRSQQKGLLLSMISFVFPLFYNVKQRREIKGRQEEIIPAATYIYKG